MGLSWMLPLACCAPLQAAGQVLALLAEALPLHVFVAPLELLFPALLDALIPPSLYESVPQSPFVLPAAQDGVPKSALLMKLQFLYETTCSIDSLSSLERVP